MWTCNRLDMQTLRSQLLMPKNLPDYRWIGCNLGTFFCQLELQKVGGCELVSVGDFVVSKMTPKVLNFDWLLLELNRFMRN